MAVSNKVAFIIEDDPQTSTMYSDALSDVGFEILSEMDGQKALDWLKANPAPMLIMLDVNLPHLSGDDIYDALRKDDKFGDTAIFMTTGLEYTAKVLQGELNKGDVILNKPVDIYELQTIAKGLTADKL